MAVLLPHERGEWWAPPRCQCWLCGDVPPGPVVFWTAGADEFLVLCPAHAAYLGLHLIADAREATLATGGPQWEPRATRAAVAAIQRRL